MKDTGLSAEELGKRLGVSGMSVRRWRSRKGDFQFEALYASAIRDAAYRLLIEGHLTADSPSARSILAEAPPLQAEAALKTLGLEFGADADMPAGDLADHPEQVMAALARIGADEKRRAEVRGAAGAIDRFRKMGRAWATRISTLKAAIASRELSQADKLPAYGALFYLIAVFDLIPDMIPVFGLVDDFSIVGIAAAFYASRLGGANARSSKRGADQP